MFKKAALKRRAVIAEMIGDVGRMGRVLEFGAFDNPTFRREAGDDVEYIDYFSGEELKQEFAANRRRDLEAVVTVDHVVKSHRFADEVPGAFDLIVANHVVEHIADLIGWLEQVESLLAEGGRVFLSVPDRRYTFDYFRAETTAVQLLRAHEEKLERPDFWQILDHMYYHQKVDSKQIWKGHLPERFQPRFSLAEACRRAKARTQAYANVHCWVFTAQSFERCMDDLKSAAAIPLLLDSIAPPDGGFNEFWVALRR